MGEIYLGPNPSEIITFTREQRDHLLVVPSNFDYESTIARMSYLPETFRGSLEGDMGFFEM